MADNPRPQSPKPKSPPKVLTLDQCDYLEILYHTFMHELKRYVKARVSDSKALEDITQNAWLRLARSDWFTTRAEPYCYDGEWADPTDPEHRSAIWATIRLQARYARTSYYKRSQVELAGEDIKVELSSLNEWMQGGGDKADDTQGHEEGWMMAESVETLRAHGFNPTEIAVFMFHVWKRQTFRQIAAELGISKSKVARIIDKIEAYFEDSQDSSDD